MSLTTIGIFWIFWLWSASLSSIAQYMCQLKKSPKTSLFQIVENWLIPLLFTTLWLKTSYFPTYFILFSALTVTIYTDMLCMLISRFFSLYLAPMGIIMSYLELLPITWHDSAIALIVGYLSFYIINYLFHLIKKQDGLGQGDLDLMALIGAYTGLLGCWFTVLYASVLGTLGSLIYMLYTRKKVSVLPFGPFLCLGAMIFILFQYDLVRYTDFLF